MAHSPGSRIGPYEIRQLLGEGGMGQVYRAWDERLGREVALKLLPADLCLDPEQTRRLLQEARAVGRLDHPSILAVHDVGLHEGQPYMVTELLEGKTLRACLSGPLPLRKALGFALQIAQGLAAAHEKGIIHRDIKPENLFLTTDGRLKILDFGLAKDEPGGRTSLKDTQGSRATLPGTVLGTVAYMSPEQAKGDALDSRSDLFSFGVVFYEMLSGGRPFTGDSAPEILVAIIRRPPPDLRMEAPGLPPELAGLVERCLEKDPAHRFQTARDLASTIELFLGSGGEDSSVVPKGRSFRNLRRGRLPLLIQVGVAGLLLGAVLWLALPRQSARLIPSFQQITFRRGTVYTARFLPREEGIVYSAEWDGGKRELFATLPGTVESRALGQAGTDVSGILAAGEIQVLRRHGRMFAPATLARLPLAGGPAKDLIEGITWADCLPGGSPQVLVRPKDGKVQLEFPAGKVIYESTGQISYPRISPSGDRVAFLEFLEPWNEAGDLVVIDRQGIRKVVSPKWKSIEGVAWRNEKEIWFCASAIGTALWLQSCDLEGRVKLLCRVPGRLVLHDLRADGKALAERNSYRASLHCQTDGNAIERDLSWLDFSELAALSRDGRFVLFTESGDGAGPRNVAYLRGTDGSPPLRLGEGIALALSADARHALLFAGEEDRRLLLVPVGSGTPKELPRGPLVSYQWAAFRPGDRSIVLLAREAGKALRIYLQDLDGGLPTLFGPEGFSPADGGLEPGGANLLGSAKGKAVLLPMDGGPLRTLDRIPSGMRPLGWVGRDLVLAESRPEGVQLFRCAPSSGTPQPWRKLAPPDPAGLLSVRTAGLSADGRVLVYQTYRLLSDLYVISNLD